MTLMIISAATLIGALAALTLPQSLALLFTTTSAVILTTVPYALTQLTRGTLLTTGQRMDNLALSTVCAALPVAAFNSLAAP